MEGEKRKLIKFSNYSLCITIPKWIVRKLGWEKGDTVDLDVDAKSGSVKIYKKEDKKNAKIKIEKNDKYRW